MVERYRTRAMRLISELDAGGDYRALIETRAEDAAGAAGARGAR